MKQNIKDVLLLLILAFATCMMLVSCGDNHGGDDDIIDDTTLTPPTDTLGVDSVVAHTKIGNNTVAVWDSSIAYSVCRDCGTDWGDWFYDGNTETMERIQKRKVGEFAPVERSIVYYQVVKRTLKYKL